MRQSFAVLVVSLAAVLSATGIVLAGCTVETVFKNPYYEILEIELDPTMVHYLARVDQNAFLSVAWMSHPEIERGYGWVKIYDGESSVYVDQSNIVKVQSVVAGKVILQLGTPTDSEIEVWVLGDDLETIYKGPPAGYKRLGGVDGVRAVVVTAGGYTAGIGFPQKVNLGEVTLSAFEGSYGECSFVHGGLVITVNLETYGGSGQYDMAMIRGEDPNLAYALLEQTPAPTQNNTLIVIVVALSVVAILAAFARRNR